MNLSPNFAKWWLLISAVLILSTATAGECDENSFEWGMEDDVKCITLEDVTLESFLENYKPIYVTELPSGERLTILKESLVQLVDFRRQQQNGTSDSRYELGVTPFVADSPEEQKQRSGFQYINVSGTEDDLPRLDLVMAQENETEPVELPDIVDWVSEGAVTSVKDQGRCGSCWAWAVAAVVESAAYIQNDGYFQSMSAQQYVSCSDKLNGGCDGGSLVVTMGYTALNSFGGVSTLNEYPYTDYRGGTTEECLLDDKTLAVEIEEPKIAFDTTPVGNYQDRLQLVKSILVNQPVAVAMVSSCWTFQSYRRGIMTDDGKCACTDPVSSVLDHTVLLTGYDDTTDPPSFTLKNQWGTGWGEKGYFRVSQEEVGPYGLFGILGHGVIPGLVTNTTAPVEDEKQKTPLKPWAIILIVAAGCVVCWGVYKYAMTKRAENKAGEETAAPAADT